MPLNHKLTNVIRGRVIRRFQESGGELLIGFHDGSAMRIREMETNSPPLAVGAQIKLIEEDGAEFTIRCEDGTSLSLQRLSDAIESMAPSSGCCASMINAP